MSMPTYSTGQQDLRTYVRIFWRWKLLLLAFLVLIPLGVYLIERGKSKVYQSSTLLEVQDVSVTVGSPGAPVLTGNLNAIARLVTTTPVARAAAGLLHEDRSTAGSLLSEISASANTDTGFLTITARDHDPQRAAAIARAFAGALASHQTAQAIHNIDQQVSSAAKQLAAVPRSDPVTRTALVQQIARLRALRGSTSSGAQVIEPAVAATTPVGPQVRRAVELALIIALVLGIGAVLVAENADRRIRTPEDLEHLTSWPLLGVVPSSAFSPDKPTARDDEAFQMLHAALTYFNVDRPPASVAVMSPIVGDGKTTVAVGLAVATARAGKRAVLVDADLRRPQVCARLGIAATAGLGAVLVGERRLTDVIVEHPVDAPEGGRMFVLPAGPAAPKTNCIEKIV
jgi:capsular polysaccharide biosynthesis protein